MRWSSVNHVWPRPYESGIYKATDPVVTCYHAVLVERGWEGPCRRYGADQAVVDLRHMRELHEDLRAGMFTASPGPQQSQRRAA